MSFTDVLDELPAMTIAQRQLLVRRAMDLDESPLPVDDEALVERRLEEHRQNTESAVSLEEMKMRLRSRFGP